MKTNSILRIAIWSLVIVILTGILIAGISLKNFLIYDWDSVKVEESHGPVYIGPGADETPITSPTRNTDPSTGPATDPTEHSEPQPTQDPAPTTEAVPAAPSMDGLSFPAGDVSDITIEWVAGSITIEAADVDAIYVSETEVTDEKYAMQWKLNRGKLTITYCEASFRTGLGIGLHGALSKDLTILVPRDWIGSDLELDAASATLEVTGLTLREVEIDTASGTCTFEDCDVGSLDVDTASGNITFSGALTELDCDAASASFTGVLSNTPSRIDMDSASGDLELTLPQDTGFTVEINGMRSEFSSDFETTYRNGAHVYGNGRCRIEMDAMSGDVIIHRG